MTDRDKLVEIGARSLTDSFDSPFYVEGYVDYQQYVQTALPDMIRVVLDAVEPLIRADERERIAQGMALRAKEAALREDDPTTTDRLYWKGARHAWTIAEDIARNKDD